MLVLARESRSLTQGQLAEVMQKLEGSDSRVSQGYVSRAEAGRLPVAGDRLELYAQAVGYPVSLLCLTEQEVGAGVGLVHHRKKQAAAAGDLKRIHAMMNLTRIQLRRLSAGTPRRTGLGIPRIEVDDLTTPSDAARAVRRALRVPPGPVESVVQLLESAGALVVCRELVAPVPLDSGTETVPVDAVSCAPGDEDPLVVLNSGTPAERQRFTLAHELGHMVMHAIPHPDQEKQANSFAAELLMPARAAREALRSQPVSVPRLLELKQDWNVSMWALLRRAHTLGVLSDWQYRTLAVEMSSLGYRTSEPGPLEPELPTAVDSMVAWRMSRGDEITELARTTFLTPDEFVNLYASRPGGVAAGSNDRCSALTATQVREVVR
ncbi:Zn-dependent peptidase ImmA (M78 family)/transcriptional regulator with XRE-family HTH domain [Nocardia transvalensis]|uniref:Zn-dependent peptidase ImmA (M78 family)/transcriptional regulator with XRE-family HTH domain n=2 Tax=Nocardia transvalensis TaxID=37333 RepID=A0A7W9PDH1_9NOCA|nr:XRE family transcriptional regulator [Nocardia transvalensis]MBB5913930.1 Zn-dependent peptidase ImmA (M78 family)/transcriptional regulator with XRE-family HTH domain [Nocardia transvalensis]